MEEAVEIITMTTLLSDAARLTEGCHIKSAQLLNRLYCIYFTHWSHPCQAKMKKVIFKLCLYVLFCLSPSLTLQSQNVNMSFS